MSKNPKEFVKIFQCPDCGGELVVTEDGLRCEKCERPFPIYNGVAIFVSQDEWREFFKAQCNLDNYIIDEEREVFERALVQDDYFEAIKIMDEHTGTAENKALTAEKWADYDNIPWIDNEAQQAAVWAGNEKMIALGNVAQAKMILDWPTGPGTCVRKMVNKIGKDAVIVSSEINLLAIFRLKKYLEAKGLANNILFVNNDVAKMPFKDSVFDLVTALGLTTEVPESDKALKETFRIMQDGGIMVGNGDLYHEGSESIKIADEMNLGQIATRERFLEKANAIGFKNIEIETAWEGLDTDDSPDEERCPLPARGDWSAYTIIRAEK